MEDLAPDSFPSFPRERAGVRGLLCRGRGGWGRGQRLCARTSQCSSPTSAGQLFRAAQRRREGSQ